MGRAPSGGCCWSFGVGGRELYEGHIFNEMWARYKIYILVHTLLVEIFYLTLSTGTASEQ
jgi:hypothetical protein